LPPGEAREGSAAAATLVGFAAGAIATGAGALLLYTTRGMLATAGFLVAVTTVSLAGGAWVGGGERDAGPVATRGRWLALLGALLLAVAWALLWGARPALRAVPHGGALAVLVFLAAPAYLSGGVLAALHRNGARGVVPLALAGSGLGALAAALYFIPRYDPYLLFLAAAAVTLAAWRLEGGQAMQPEAAMDGKVVIVTGVGDAGQVGYAVAERFSRAGARLVLADLERAVETLAQQIGGGAHGVAADLSTAAGARQVVEAARARWGGVDVLVNVAGGLSVIETVEDTTPELWRQEQQRNAETVLMMSRAALPLLRESGGAIVNFASPAAQRAPARLAAYAAGKAGVVALTRALALEEKAAGVRVNAIAPATIDTAQNRAAAADDAAEYVTREQVAEVAFFLASPAAAGINGAVVEVAGAALE
jgi:NAD(P)-dependent dehydrogenase (short-subunit alcohol dehydrogenase family)